MAAERRKSLIPVNVTGAIAAIALDMAFPWQITKAFALIGRTLGVVGHIAAEIRNPMGAETDAAIKRAIVYEPDRTQILLLSLTGLKPPIRVALHDFHRFAGTMKFFAIVLPAVLLPLSLIAFSGRGTHSVQNQALSAPAGADATEKMNDSWAKDQKLLVAYEREQSKLRAEVIHRRRLYQEGQLVKAEVLDAERALVSALSRIHEVRRSMTETDIAITEATFKDELLRMPTPAVNGFSETEHLSRFNGGARWSLKQAPGIEKFYSQTFGRNLPVTAYGQTATHDQMRFNHRDSMDVALHPDSPEGKALISHLRRSGIPFIAFKGRVAGASTGAHIHIGHPSHRTASN